MSKPTRGQVTYDAEGNDTKGSKYFSRIIHWPGNALSGVTIGRGYDIGNRTSTEVERQLKAAGIPDAKAKLIAKGARLKGSAAKKFVEEHKASIGEITLAAQVKLFNAIYPAYENRAKANYNKWTSGEKTRLAWDKLDGPIRDILVDFVYQGFTKGANPMKAGMHNKYDELIQYIEGSATMKKYEAGRKRAKYLRSRKPVKKAKGK